MWQEVDGRIDGSITTLGEISGSAGAEGEIRGELGGEPNAYAGQTVFIPGTEEQIVRTEGLLVGTNIIIEAIPDYYGRIEWNGVYLTVS